MAALLTEDALARFWARVALPNEQGCMLWLGHVSVYGYGWFTPRGSRRPYAAHRVSYELAYGRIPDGLVIDHVRANGCTNRHCVAPLHLEAVTQAENVRRSDAGRNQLVKTHCPQGHPYAGANLYIQPRGGRVCRACKNAKARDAYQKAREA